MFENNERRMLAEVLPDFAAELQGLLTAEGRGDLAAQVAGLRIVERCPCLDSFCASFYTLPRPSGHYGPNYECLPLSPREGMVILDVVDKIIVHVEVLYRPEIREKLLTAFP